MNTSIQKVTEMMVNIKKMHYIWLVSCVLDRLEIKSLPAFLTRPRKNNILKVLANFNQLEVIFCNNGW